MTSDGPLVNLDFEETHTKANFPVGTATTTVIAAVHHQQEREPSSQRSPPLSSSLLNGGGPFAGTGGGGGGEPIPNTRSASHVVDSKQAKARTKQYEISGDLSTSLSDYERNNGSVNSLSSGDFVVGTGGGGGVVVGSSTLFSNSLTLIPEVHFEGITLDSGIDRESQPLLGGREHEITYNQFPGEWKTVRCWVIFLQSLKKGIGIERKVIYVLQFKYKLALFFAFRADFLCFTNK